MEKRAILASILALTALSAAYWWFFWDTPPASGDDASRAEEDAFIKEYLAKEEAVVDVPASIVDLKASTTATTTSTLLALPACPDECCPEDGGAYAPKGCGPYFVCENGTCLDPPCPFECCVLGMYADRLCRSPLICENSTCVKADCPDDAECCDEAGYSYTKPCPEGQACEAGACKTLDTDGDGLSDHAERELGTNATMIDSDGDGLGDYAEVMAVRTSPLDPDTDGDRYPDAVDKNPTVTDSAMVNVTILSASVDRDLDALHEILMHLDFGQSPPSGNDSVASFASNIWVANTGSDYTPYVNYTYSIGYRCAPGVDVRRKPFIYRYIPADNVSWNVSLRNSSWGNVSWVGERGEQNDTKNATYWDIRDYQLTEKRIEPGTRYIRYFRAVLRYKDIPNDTLEALVSERSCGYNITIKDVRYERF
ncbi:MAG: hypothetical protein V1875_06935 [Candidatus Altiarchaeota archaeon]